MKKYKILAALAGLILAGTLPSRNEGGLFAADDESAREGVKKYGIVHNIAEDRRVEKVGGLYEPEGLDIYVKRHLDSLAAEIKGLESRLDAMNKKIDEVSGLLQALNASMKKSPPNDKGKRHL